LTPSHEFYVRTGPFVCHLRTTSALLAETVDLLYSPALLLSGSRFSDFQIELETPPLRRLFRPKIFFRLDGAVAFKPTPAAHAPVSFEWGLNWAIANVAADLLVLHAAVLERNGRALILPGEPGAGKSTLCAALAFRGWRLLSDELTLVRLEDRSILPLARPISLKNESIEVIRRFVPEAIFSAPVEDTQKGRVALVRAPEASIAEIDRAAQARFIVFPRFVAGAPVQATPRSKAATVIELGRNAMTYSTLGRDGFEAACDLVDQSECLDFSYGNLDEALAFLSELHDR
jgi:HprK-related kinase A